MWPCLQVGLDLGMAPGSGTCWWRGRSATLCGPVYSREACLQAASTLAWPPAVEPGVGDRWWRPKTFCSLIPVMTPSTTGAP